MGLRAEAARGCRWKVLMRGLCIDGWCARGAGHSGWGTSAPERHPISEVPLVKARGTDQRVPPRLGAWGGWMKRGMLPTALSASQCGPNLVSLMAVLMGCYG